MGCAPAELTPLGARVEVARAPGAGCTKVASVSSSAGYNGRSAEANLAGVSAALRNQAALRGGDAVVITSQTLGASPGGDRRRGAIGSGGCPNCVAMTADAYRCPTSPKPQAVAPAVDPFVQAAAAAFAAATESARRCAPPGSTPGEAKVRVTFAPSGDVVYAEVEGERFTGTALGACVAGKLRNMRVPPFSGGARSREETVVLAP